MTELMKDDRTEEQAEKDELVAAEKEAKRLADEEAKKPAQSPFSGGNVYIDSKAVGDNTTIKHSYIGTGPLLVPCTRGEQKAISGDYIVQVYTLDPNDNTKESLFTFLISAEIYQVLFDALPPPATFAEQAPAERSGHTPPHGHH